MTGLNIYKGSRWIADRRQHLFYVFVAISSLFCFFHITLSLPTKTTIQGPFKCVALVDFKGETLTSCVHFLDCSVHLLALLLPHLSLPVNYISIHYISHSLSSLLLYLKSLSTLGCLLKASLEISWSTSPKSIDINQAKITH